MKSVFKAKYNVMFRENVFESDLEECLTNESL